MNNMPATPRQQRTSAASSPRTAPAPMSERQQMALLMQMTSQDKPPTPPVNAGEERRKSRQQRNERGETPLHIAAKKGELEQVQKLLQQGSSPNVTDFAGWTPLHEACSYGWFQIVQALVASGADVNARGLDEDTPLHDAAGTGNLQMVKYLVEHGADPCAKNNVGKMASDFSSELIYNYLISVKESAGGIRAAHAARVRDDAAKKGAPAEGKRGDPLADAGESKEPPPAASAAVEKTTAGESKDESHSQASSGAVTSAQDEVSAEGESGDASDEDASKRKKRKEEPSKETPTKTAPPPRATTGRLLTGTKPPGPASKTGAVPLGKNSQGASGLKPSSSGFTPSKGAPGPAGKAAAVPVAHQGKSTTASKSSGPVAAASKGADRKSPDDTAKPNPAKEPMEVDSEETKTPETPGPKVPPLKIVIPGGGGGSGAAAEGDGGAARGAGGKGRGAATLPYVMPCVEPAAAADGSDSDDKRSAAAEEKRVLRSHRVADEREGRASPPPGGLPLPAPPAAASATVASTSSGAPPADPPLATTVQEEQAATTASPSSTTTSTASSSTSWSGTSSNELHPRKRKIRASRDAAHREPPAEPAAAEPPPAHHANPYQQYIDIRRQIERRQKALFPVQPKPPQGFKDYLMNRGTYLLQRNIKQEPTVTMPAMLPPQMLDQFILHERERHDLKIQHVIEKEKLVLAVEQEILRVHGRAARALANQALPFSACTILRDQEVYNAITPEQEEKERNAQRSRYNGRLFLSWLQDVDDKWEKIKEGMVRRHHTEAETLHAVQKMQWEWKLKEYALCDSKSTPRIEPAHVPQVHVSDDFDLLPA